MQSLTNCKINVSPGTGTDVEREISLMGSRAAVAEAKRTIWEKVEVALRVGRIYLSGTARR